MSKYLTLAILTIVVLAAASCGDSRKDVIREVPVEKVVTREVVKEVPVEKIVEVEKEVVRTVEVEKPVEVIREVVREVEVPGETVVVEKEVVRTVEVVKEVAVEKVVVAESQASAAPAPTAAPAATPAPQAAAMPDPAARSGATPPATSFQDYQRARFASTVNDAVSTFSLDTDRTSYHLALNWAQSGYEVEPDSVQGRGVDQCLRLPLRSPSAQRQLCHNHRCLQASPGQQSAPCPHRLPGAGGRLRSQAAQRYPRARRLRIDEHGQSGGHRERGR